MSIVYTLQFSNYLFIHLHLDSDSDSASADAEHAMRNDVDFNESSCDLLALTTQENCETPIMPFCNRNSSTACFDFQY